MTVMTQDTLLPAMKVGVPIALPGPVSRDLVTAAETFQELNLVRHGGPDLPPDRGSFAFFTARVDAFYSALCPLMPLTHLMYVHGFDIPLYQETFRETVGVKIREAAEALDLPLLQVETNLRDLTNPVVNWARHLHGSGLSSVGLLLGNDVDTLMIPSSYPPATKIGDGWGSHPTTDRLHRTAYLSVRHDAGDVAPRTDKTAHLTDFPVALEYVRVCYKSRELYKCGHCHKCRRTLIDLELEGAREKVGSFEEVASLDDLLTAVRDYDKGSLTFSRGTRNRAARMGAMQVEQALTTAINRYENKQLITQPKERMPQLVERSDLRSLSRSISRAVANPRLEARKERLKRGRERLQRRHECLTRRENRVKLRLARVKPREQRVRIAEQRSLKRRARRAAGAVRRRLRARLP